MITGEFEYFAPTTLDEAIGLLTEHSFDAKILAGGQSLIPAMRYRLAMPGVLIDINRIAGMEYIREENGYLAMGAMTRESDLDESAIIHENYDLLAETVHVIADPLVRNQATIGGNLAHADPANDHPATMLAYNATIVARGPNGDRLIAIDDFFVDLFENSLEDNEILTEIRVPTPSVNSGGAYTKIERKVGDYAIAAVAVQLQVNSGVISNARIGLTNVSPVPIRALNAEAAINGQSATDEAAIRAAGEAAAAECDPTADLRGGEDYKRDMVRVLTMRTIRKAVERATGG